MSCLEEAIVYARFVSGGVQRTSYVGLAEVESAKAQGFLKAIIKVLVEGLTLEKALFTELVQPTRQRRSSTGFL